MVFKAIRAAKIMPVRIGDGRFSAFWLLSSRSLVPANNSIEVIIKALPKYRAETFTYCGLIKKTTSGLITSITRCLGRRPNMLIGKSRHKSSPKTASAPLMYCIGK